MPNTALAGLILPADLLIPLSAIALISGFLAWLGIKARGIYSNGLALLAVGVVLTYALWLNNNPLLAYMLPVANVVAWGNLQTPAMGLLAGIAWARLRGPSWQKGLLVGALICIGIWRFVEPYIGSRPVIGPAHWSHGICVQSTKSTCSAAAAATLLNCAGIRSNEAEMTDLCLTTDDGTSILGLYRGLKIKTDGTRWRLVVLDASANELKREMLPAIMTISDASVPGGLHSVVVFGFQDQTHLDIGDPFTGGHQTWTVSALKHAEFGDRLALESRKTTD